LAVERFEGLISFIAGKPGPRAADRACPERSRRGCPPHKR